MISKNLGKAVGVGLLLCSSTNLFADADIAVQTTDDPLEATANVDLCVVVPQILIFGVGENADTVAKLQWTHTNAAAGGILGNDNETYTGALTPFTAPAPLNAVANVAITNDGGNGTATANVAELPVFLFSNSGENVTITSTISGGATGGGTVDALDHDTTAGLTIPIANFSSGSSTIIPQPALTNNSSAVTVHTDGIVNATDTWSYTYTNPAVPAAGTYEARVTYVASTP